MTLSHRMTLEGDVLPEVSLLECPAGLFFAGTQLCLKTDTMTDKGFIIAYVVESGEFFWGDGRWVPESQHAERVRPVELTSRWV